MEVVKKYKTIDGRLFDDESKAENYECLLSDVNLALCLVRANETEDGCEFSNGGGYKQLKPLAVDDFISLYGGLVEREFPDIHNVFLKNPRGIIGRYLGDYETPLYSLWDTLCCIDSNNRLWGQQYFAFFPNEGKQIAL